MTDQDERLKQLAEMASNEQELQKFMAFAREINLILEEKQEHLARLRVPATPAAEFRGPRHHLDLPARSVSCVEGGCSSMVGDKSPHHFGPRSASARLKLNKEDRLEFVREKVLFRDRSL